MGVRVTLTFVRPNTGVAWHTLSSSQHNYCETNYIDTGKKQVVLKQVKVV